MAARSSIYKYDVMKVLLLGYLYFYIAYICPAKSSDLDTSWEISLENCSAYNIKLKTCTCWKNYLGSENFYFREMQQRFTTITQMSIFMLFGFGLIGLILIYCKICHRSRQRTRSIALQEERDTQCSTIEDLRDRPPPYNEMAYNAPPLYTSPYNRASMQEAPPSYPGTPKLQERSQDTNDQFSSRNSTFVASSIAQHI
ncbi:uncharacterized protein LOC115239084 isoform X2 [Formica exsecta]|uniref:uncharacterized protein LOC115239084 isoform X2 n=1 Tax=Formica exsecta TaxID=72781 RepID=UPI001141463C|nr:uncharacterized protein LOC115239084 isoform X2 [Formica exsecta]